MSFQSDLYSRLSGYAGLTALVDYRIYPATASPTSATPYCTYQIIHPQRFYSHQGFTGLVRYRVQVSCVAADPDTARNVATQVIAAMEGWPDANSAVQSCFHDGDFDEYDEQAEVHHVPVDFLVHYGEE